MRVSRMDLLPMLTIVAGVALGASLSFGFLGSRSNDVPAANPIVAPSMTPEARADAIERAEHILRTLILEFGVEEPFVEGPLLIDSSMREVR